MHLDEKKPTFNPEINKERLYTPWELEQMKKEKARQRMQRRQARIAQNNPEKTAEQQTEESTENSPKEEKPSAPLSAGEKKIPYGTLITMGIISGIAVSGVAVLNMPMLPMSVGIALMITGLVMEIRHKMGNRVFEHYLVIMGVIYVVLEKIAYDRGTSAENGVPIFIAMCALIWCFYQLVAKPIESLTRKIVCTEIVGAVISDYNSIKHTQSQGDEMIVFYTYLPIYTYEYNNIRYRTAAQEQVSKIPVKGAQYGLRINPRCPFEVYDRSNPGSINAEKVFVSLIIVIISIIVLSRTL